MLSFIRKNIDLLLSWIKGLLSLNITTNLTAPRNGYCIIKIRTHSINICYTDNQSTDRTEAHVLEICIWYCVVYAQYQKIFHNVITYWTIKSHLSNTIRTFYHYNNQIVIKCHPNINYKSLLMCLYIKRCFYLKKRTKFFFFSSTLVFFFHIKARSVLSSDIIVIVKRCINYNVTKVTCLNGVYF